MNDLDLDYDRLPFDIEQHDMEQEEQWLAHYDEEDELPF